MTDGGYEQFALNTEPTVKDDAVDGIFELDFQCKEDGLIISSTPMGHRITDASGSVSEPENGLLYVSQHLGSNRKPHIAVKKDCKITLRLSEKQWRFSREYHAITTKKEMSHLYGELSHSDERVLTDIAGNFIGHQEVTFTAKHFHNGPWEGFHKFSINIDLYQPSFSGGYWLPITIDPEIKNPPGGNNNKSFGEIDFIGDVPLGEQVPFA